MFRTFSGTILGGALVLAAAPAMAQAPVPAGPSDSLFARDHNISVAERPHPGYDPTPMKLGAFSGLPKIDLGVEQNDNIYASQAAKTSDAIFTISPEFDIGSNWSRNMLQGFARTASREYSKYSTESSTDWQVGGAGRLDLGHGALNVGGDAGTFTEPRSNTNTSTVSLHPIRYNSDNAYVSGVEEFNRVRLTGRFDYANLDYMNGVDGSNHVVLENDRDHTISAVSGKAEYAVSPDAAVFVMVGYNEHRYGLKPPAAPLNRDSTGTTFNVGANFDLTEVMRGEVQVGYLSQDFASASFKTITGLSALGRVEWFPTELTTITLSGSRGVVDAGVVGSPAYVAEIGGVQADHELLRNLILNAHVGFENDGYQGIDRKDRNLNASVGAKYLLNRLVGVSLSYSYLKQDSSGVFAGPKYNINRLIASTTLAF